MFDYYCHRLKYNLHQDLRAFRTNQIPSIATLVINLAFSMDKHHITIIFDKTRNIEDKEKADMVEGINVADSRDIFRASFYYHVLIKDKIAVHC